MPIVEIDMLKERNNFVTVSDFFEISPNTIGVYSVKETFEWTMIEDSPLEWIKINAVGVAKLKSFIVVYEGTCDRMIAEISNDNFTWTEIYSGDAPLDEEYIANGESFKFIRFKFENLIGPFTVTSISVKIDETYDTEDFISFLSESYVPSKIREKNPLLEDFIKTYLEMLESNTIHNRRLIDSDYYMHAISNLDAAKIYAINARAINVHGLDGESA